MITTLTVLHLIVCFVLILVVLLQTGKGSEMGAVFGGSSQTVFGSTGAAPFLSKFTTGSAIVFMLTSLLLATLASGPESSLMDEEITQTAPPATVPIKPAVPAPTESAIPAPKEAATATEAEQPAPTAPTTQDQPSPAAPEAPSATY